MIANAISYLSDQLNNELKCIYELDKDPILVSPLTHPDGSIPENLQNHLVLTLVNIEEETSITSSASYLRKEKTDFSKITPPSLNQNLYLMLSSWHDPENYLEGIKMLGAAQQYLHSHPYFSKEANGQLPEGLVKISLEIMNHPLHEIAQLWTGLGTSIRPAAIYKIRIIQQSND